MLARDSEAAAAVVSAQVVAAASAQALEQALEPGLEPAVVRGPVLAADRAPAVASARAKVVVGASRCPIYLVGLSSHGEEIGWSPAQGMIMGDISSWFLVIGTSRRKA